MNNFNIKYLFKDSLMATIFYLSLCITFFLLSINHGFYIGLYISGCISLFLLVNFFYKENIIINNYLYIAILPLLFCFFVTVTPGNFFKDMPVGEGIFLSYMSGFAASIFCKEKIWNFPFAFLLGIFLSLLAYIILGFPSNMRYDGRLTLLFFHPSVLANVCSLFIINFYSQYIYTDTNRKIISIIGCSAYLLIVFLCYSRATYLALLVSLGFLTLLIFRKYIFYIFITSTICIVILFSLLSSHQQGRIISAIQNPAGDATFISRQPIWDAAISGFEQSPWIGNGLRSFRVYHSYFIKKNNKDLLEKYPVVENNIANPHNLYLGILFAYGIIGGLLFILSLAPALYISLSSKHYLFPSIVIFYLIYGLFEYQLHRKDGIFLLFFPLGIVYGRYFIEKLQRRPPAQPQNSP